ncbi:ribosome-binding factor A, partial [Staphylococcus epidermidis]
PTRFIKSQLPSPIPLTIIPDLTFQYHQSIQYPNKIQRMIQHLHKNHK